MNLLKHNQPVTNKPKSTSSMLMIGNLSMSLAGNIGTAGVSKAIMKKSQGASLLNINEEGSNNGDSINLTVSNRNQS